MVLIEQVGALAVSVWGGVFKGGSGGCLLLQKLTDPPGWGSVSQGNSWRFPRALGCAHSGLPTLLLWQPLGLRASSGFLVLLSM